MKSPCGARKRFIVQLIVLCLMANAPMLNAASSDQSNEPSAQELPDAITLIQVLAGSKSEQRVAIRRLRRNWNDSFVTPLVELLRLNTDPSLQNEIVKLLERKTGKRFGANYQRWHRWVWSTKYSPIQNYAEFKAWLYGNIDPRFKRYFSSQHEAVIRLDEV